MSKEKKFKAPKNLATCADMLFKLRQQRLESQKVTDEIRAQETALEEHLIANLPKGHASGIAGKICRVQIVSTTVPTVNDWDKVFAFIHKKKAYDLVQKRISKEAVEGRWGEGIEIPGVDRFNVVKVSLTKLK